MTIKKASEILLALQVSVSTLTEQGIISNTLEVNELLEVLTLAVKKLTENEWILSEYGKPFDKREKLVSTKDKDIFIAFWDADTKVWQDVTSGMLIDETDVTAWMPLPEPYEVPDE